MTQKKDATFHPKIYYFRQSKNIFIITGSANLTGGGLYKNFEVSVLLETGQGSPIDMEFKSIINNYSENSTQIFGELQLNQYEREYKTYHKKHKRADKEFKEEIWSIHKFDISQINKFVKEYIIDNGFQGFNKRKENYKKAKKLLNKITKEKIISPSDFLKYYEVIAKSFHSSGLLRGKREMANKYKSILSLIKIIQQNIRSEPIVVFSKALPLVKSIERFGVNGLTEIMNTYNPNKFSVANGRTLKSLSDLGFTKFPSANNFNHKIYEEYNKLISDIAIACKFKDLGQVDHFLSWYYENHVKTKQI